MELFVERRLRSIFIQDDIVFKEVVIIDDCSIDETRNNIINFLIENDIYTRFKIIIQFNEKNLGSPLRNFCDYFHLFSGDFIWIAEGDDFLLDKYWVRKMFNIINQTNSALAFSRIIYVDSNDVRISPKLKHAELFAFKQKEWTASKYLKNYLLYNTLLTNLSAAIFRKSEIDIDFLIEVKDTFTQSGDICLQASVLFGKTNNVVFNGATESFFLRRSNSMTNINSLAGVNKLEKEKLIIAIGKRLGLFKKSIWYLYFLKRRLAWIKIRLNKLI
jgi:glycosyltransferase involved in cell wall biosynthesis